MKFILIVAIGLGNVPQIDQLTLQEFGSQRACESAALFINETATENMSTNPSPGYVNAPVAICIPYK